MSDQELRTSNELADGLHLLRIRLEKYFYPVELDALVKAEAALRAIQDLRTQPASVTLTRVRDVLVNTFNAPGTVTSIMEELGQSSTPPPENGWISVRDRMPAYQDGKGRDMSVLGWLSDHHNDFTLAAACSVSYFNIQGWVDKGKCSHWQELPDGPTATKGEG